MRPALLLFFVSTSALAQTVTVPSPPNLEDVMAARNYAMGGAYRALGYGAESVTGNPAALSLYKRYQFELSGAYDFKHVWGYGSLSVADSVTNQVAAGLSYQMVSLGNDADGTRRTAYLTTVASAVPISSVVHLGAAIRYQAITGFNETNSVTMSAGLIFRPFDELTLSVSGHNLIGVWNPDVPRYFSFAVSSLLGGQLSPTFELRSDFNDPGGARFAYSGGIEWLAGGSFPLRAGYSWDGIQHTQYFGCGVGFFQDGSGVDLAYRHELTGDGRMIAATIKVQFN